jgi:hypothetical protein
MWYTRLCPQFVHCPVRPILAGRLPQSPYKRHTGVAGRRPDCTTFAGKLPLAGRWWHSQWVGTIGTHPCPVRRYECCRTEKSQLHPHMELSWDSAWLVLFAVSQLWWDRCIGKWCTTYRWQSSCCRCSTRIRCTDRRIRSTLGIAQFCWFLCCTIDSHIALRMHRWWHCPWTGTCGISLCHVQRSVCYRTGKLLLCLYRHSLWARALLEWF